MSYEINCPFCDLKVVSDVVDKKEQVDGEWQCDNGHTFLLAFLETIEGS